jgi:hypothetical protein
MRRRIIVVLVLAVTLATVLAIGPRKPETTIVHLRDWHFVPYSQFVVDQNQASGKELCPDELAALWNGHLETVDRVQVEQMAMVRKLGVREILSEGLSAQGMEGYMARLRILKEHEEGQPDLLVYSGDLDILSILLPFPAITASTSSCGRKRS